MNYRGRASALLAIALLALGGCSTTDKETRSVADNEVSQLERQMRGWPSLEATEQQVTDTLRQIADAAAAIEPALQWREHRDRSSGTCKGAFADTTGVSVHTSALLSAAPIPDATWQQVLAEAKRLAAAVGIDRIEERVEQAGHHDVRLYSDNGAEIRIVTQNNARIVADTGCRFTEKYLESKGE